ncbi:MAG: acylphosphatase [Acidimicrobiales bacterium]
MTPIRRRVVVSGRVQGVGFRQAALDAAARRRVSGWVRNRRDGRVEAVLEGPPGDVVAVVEWCRHGPPLARVTGLEVFEETPELLSGFRIASSA